MLLLLSVLACGPSDGEDTGGEPAVVLDPALGLLGTGRIDPFPSFLHVGADGHVALDAGDWPTPADGTPVPVERLAWRTGFSPSQPIVVQLPGVDAARLPSWRTDAPAGVRLWDLTAGTPIPVMAELDAHPDAAPDPTTIIRPMAGLPEGHTIAVVVDADTAPRPDAFAAALADPGAAPWGPHLADLADRLAALGEDPASLAVFWDFPVGDATRPLTSALEAAAPASAFTLDDVRDSDAGDPTIPHVWRAATGHYTVTSFLVDGTDLDLGPDGAARPVGTAEAYVYVSIPDSVADAPAGSAPIWIFGHGMFGSPAKYLDEAPDDDEVMRLADEAGAIVVATYWTGLSEEDIGIAVQSAADFGRFTVMGDRLVQAQVNVQTLISLVRDGGLLDDPALLGRQGQRLGNADELAYYGISLGGLEGLVVLAQDNGIDAGVLHVGGGMFMTCLERSTPWTLFETLLELRVPDPAHRQQAVALSQLWLDPVDPMTWATRLDDTPILWHESIGDNFVPNMATDAVIRTAGVPLALPAHRPPYGIDTVALPLPPGSSALVQLDPQVGEPPDTNRPADDLGAHGDPRLWDGVRAQTRDFLDPDAWGQVLHHCGDAACSASNPGTP